VLVSGEDTQKEKVPLAPERGGRRAAWQGSAAAAAPHHGTGTGRPAAGSGRQPTRGCRGAGQGWEGTRWKNAGRGVLHLKFWLQG